MLLPGPAGGGGSGSGSWFWAAVSASAGWSLVVPCEDAGGLGGGRGTMRRAVDPPPLWESLAALGAALPETAAPVAAMIVLFWVIAVTITLYNKWTFSSQQPHPNPSRPHHLSNQSRVHVMWAAFGFHFPVTFICGTFSLNWVLAAGLRRSLRAARLAAAPAGQPPTLPAAPSQRKVVTIGVCTAFEIAASNLSLLTLSVSFHTMIKSSTPLFVLIAAIALGLEQPTRLLIASMMLVTGGVMLCSAGEIKFDWGGFMYILTASMAGGVRWSLAQLLLQREGGAEASAVGARDNISDVLLHNLEKCVELLYHQLPVSVAALIPAWLLLERVRFTLWIAAQEESSGMLALKLGLVVAGCALLAFVLIVTELSLLTLTSSVTLVSQNEFTGLQSLTALMHASPSLTSVTERSSHREGAAADRCGGGHSARVTNRD